MATLRSARVRECMVLFEREQVKLLPGLKAWALAALTSLASLSVLNRQIREISHWQTAEKGDGSG